MIAPLLAAALIATPIQTPDHFDLAQERSVNVAKPMHGGYSDQIAAAASVPKKWIGFSKCVLDRESGGTLTRKNSGEGAKNPRSSASGRWQFLDTHWRHGGSFMVRDRLIDHGMPKDAAQKLRKHLGKTPIHKWDGWFQDTLFNEVIARGGWAHWSGGGGCNSLKPSSS